MTYIAVCTVVLLVVAIAWSARRAGRVPEAYRQRACQGAIWRRSFPSAPKENIRAFLSVFAESFAFASSDKLIFSPDDKVLDIYRELYPQRWLPDALEVEMFAKQLERRFDEHLETLWSEQLTLGDVFRAVETAGGARSSCGPLSAETASRG